METDFYIFYFFFIDSNFRVYAKYVFSLIFLKYIKLNNKISITVITIKLRYKLF